MYTFNAMEYQQLAGTYLKMTIALISLENLLL